MSNETINFDKVNNLNYMSGFDNDHCSEALPGALPIGQFAPQKCPYGLYAEQISGTAFTVPRVKNRRTWVYRIRPGVVHTPFKPVVHDAIDKKASIIDPNQLRWNPPAIPTENVDFVHGLITFAAAGEETMRSGLGIQMYLCNTSMGKAAMYNSDGDYLIVPQQGDLLIHTELGKLRVEPNEIAVIPRGIRFSVDVFGPSRGYICELYGGHFQLPDLGPIGANGLANSRDFLYPVASFVDENEEFTLYNKFGGKLFVAQLAYNPFNVVAWSGNYAPYKYDLRRFNTMNTVSYDHADPSIFTVLTCPSDTPGVADCDFVIFPPRYMVARNTFRPPYYHRNLMSEFMGMIWGNYDAKKGFQAGGGSLHSCMTPHGPDTATFIGASNAELAPEYFDKGLAFMFETRFTLKVTDHALNGAHRDFDYQKCWEKLPSFFNPETKVIDKIALPNPN